MEELVKAKISTFSASSISRSKRKSESTPKGEYRHHNSRLPQAAREILAPWAAQEEDALVPALSILSRPSVLRRLRLDVMLLRPSCPGAVYDLFKALDMALSSG